MSLLLIYASSGAHVSGKSGLSEINFKFKACVDITNALNWSNSFPHQSPHLTSSSLDAIPYNK